MLDRKVSIISKETSFHDEIFDSLRG